MKRIFTGPIFLSLTALSLMFSGCGGTGGTGISTVSGVAAAGSPLVGTAYLKDSTAPAKELTAMIKSDGSYTFDVTGMQGPFILEATGTVGTTSYTLHSFATGPGIANINPMSNVMVASAAGGTDPAQIFASPSLSLLQGIAANMPAADSTLMTSLKPLMTLYGATADPISGQFVANHTGLDAMLDAVTMNFSAGTITVMNTSTKTMIFTAQATNVGGGTFTMANMPTAPATTTMMPTTTTSAFDGAAFYTANCASCHRALATSDKLGATATQIQTGISGNMSGMGQFSSLTAAQVQAIATALNPTASTTTTMMPTTTTTTPTTSTTTPIFDGAAYYTANCVSCHGAIATSAFHGATATLIQSGISSNMGGMGKFSSLTAAQIQAISTALQ